MTFVDLNSKMPYTLNEPTPDVTPTDIGGSRKR